MIFFSHWNQVQIIDFGNWQDPIIFFQQSPNPNIHFHEHWCTFHLKSYKEKKNPPFSKFLLNSLLSGSSSGVKLFIFNISAMKLFLFNILAIRLFIVIVKEIKLFIFAIFFKSNSHPKWITKFHFHHQKHRQAKSKILLWGNN